MLTHIGPGTLYIIIINSVLASGRSHGSLSTFQGRVFYLCIFQDVIVTLPQRLHRPEKPPMWNGFFFFPWLLVREEVLLNRETLHIPTALPSHVKTCVESDKSETHVGWAINSGQQESKASIKVIKGPSWDGLAAGTMFFWVHIDPRVRNIFIPSLAIGFLIVKFFNKHGDG